MASDTATRISERTARSAGEREPRGAEDRAPHRARRWLRRARPSPLTLRILAVNVLALALLVAGLLYLGRYQDRLITAELEALRTEARIFASALGEGAVQRAFTTAGTEVYTLSPELARQMVRRLVETTETRTRLYGQDGAQISDSRVLVGSPGTIQIAQLPPPDTGGALARVAVRVYDWLTDAIPDRAGFPLYSEPHAAGRDHPADVARALAGEVAATVWRSDAGHGDTGLVLTMAVPVQRYKQVLGAVLLSRGGAEIDEAIRSVRFDILRVFAVALAVTVLLSLYLAGTIARPVRRLAGAAERVRSGHGRHAEIPDFTGRGDEIGDLSGALRAMTAELWSRMDAIERFAADVAHEIKNPLTSLRSAVETATRVTDPERRERLMAIIADDVMRLDRLISDISNASRLDAELSRAELEPVDIGAVLTMLAALTAGPAGDGDVRAADGLDDGAGGGAGDDRRDGGAPRVTVTLGPGDLTVAGLEGRLTQVFQNLIANALSFSPPGGAVRLSATRDGRTGVVVSVVDDGPGLPEGKEAAIFERFYTERPAGEKFGTHSGLGLSISKQIVEAHGGTITAANRHHPDGRVAGARFTVRLPATG